MPKVISVNPQGAAYLKIKEQDNIIAFNDRPFEDILDYIYADSDATCRLSVIDKDGFQKIITVKKDCEEQTLGLEFDSSVELTPRRCRNNCIFCFVNQLPRGLRDTLYIKDDDYRLSFISGCYISCTNLSEKDIRRIIDYQLSPLYVSVHSTDERIRQFLLGVDNTDNQVDILKRFVKAGINIHTQIVIVPNINDGVNLKNSLAELFEIGVKSVAVVPVGITKYREELYNINPITELQAKTTIGIVEEFYDKHNYFCYASDEMYQIAQLPIKPYAYYENFPQIENGVGLIAKFLYELEESCENMPKRCNKSIGIITGVSGEATMLKAKHMLEENCKKLKVNVYTIKNQFFGNTVTVSGLVTGRDIINYFQDHTIQEDYFLIPSVMLKENEDIFLDGISLDELQESLDKKIVVCKVDGESLVEAIMYGEQINRDD